MSTEDTDDENPMEFVAEPEKIPALAPLFGAEVDEEGHLRDAETGEIYESPDGKQLTIDEMAYLGHDDETGGIVPIPKGFTKVHNFLRGDRDEE